MKPETMMIDDVKYVREDAVNKMASERDGMKYVIARTYSAGVFAGFLESRDGQEVVMRDARRLWQWSGAAPLSQLAMSGTSKPDSSKFPETVYTIELLQVVEILHCTKTAKESIESVEIWVA